MPGYNDGAKTDPSIANQVQETQISGQKGVNDEYSSPPSQAEGTGTNLKRKIQESSQSKDKKQKKKETDKKYRDAIKRERTETQKELGTLKGENGRLKLDNERLQTQLAERNQSLQSKDEEIKQLGKRNDQLEGKIEGKDLTIEVLTEQLANSRDANLQHENTRLKCTITLLKKQINNQENAADITQNGEKIAELKDKNKQLEIIVTALTKKIKNDKYSEGEIASSL